MLKGKSIKTRNSMMQGVQNDSFASLHPHPMNLKKVLWQVFAISLVACNRGAAHAGIVETGWLLP